MLIYRSENSDFFSAKKRKLPSFLVYIYERRFFLIQNYVNEYILESLPKIFDKHPNLFSERDKYKDFLEKKIYLKEQNILILKEISKGLKKDLGVDYSVRELYFMQKFYLMYPDVAPLELLSLSWEHIQILLHLFSKRKRDFYVEKCIAYKWDILELQKAILHDMYDKYVFVKKQYKNGVFSDEKFFEIQDNLWINE